MLSLKVSYSFFIQYECLIDISHCLLTYLYSFIVYLVSRTSEYFEYVILLKSFPLFDK